MPGIDAAQRFPFIGLERAIERAKQLYDADQRGGEMATSGAFAVWEYSEKSSGGFQTVAALKMYGLLEPGDGRKLKLSKAALDYFRDEREDRRATLLEGFATRPALIRSLWNEWGSTPPGDALARSHLKVDRGLSEQSARTLLGIYKDNLTFANLKGGAKIPEPSTDMPEDEAMESSNIREENIAGGVAARREVSDINVVQKGSRLQISATVDLDGIERLKKMLDAYAEALKLLQ
jgi:hypothetical protein